VRAADINVQEMENIVFEGAEAAVARINLEAAPDEDTLAALRDDENIIELSVLKLQQ
jgi:D-3-phosphoglycerate dehydrogenase